MNSGETSSSATWRFPGSAAPRRCAETGPCSLLPTRRNLLIDHATNTSYRPKGAAYITQTGDLSNFHEKAHFVKADVAAPLRGRAQRLRVLRHASIRTVRESTFLGDSVHYEIHLFGLLSEGAAIFGTASPPHRGWTKFATCAVALA